MGFLAALSTFSTFLSSLRLTVFSSLQINWKFLQWVLLWHWQTWFAIWSGVWILVILRGSVAVVRKRETTTTSLIAESEVKLRQQAEGYTAEVESLRAEIASCREAAKGEADRRSKKFSFWLEAKKSDPSRAHHFKYWQNGEEKTMDAVIPFIRLLVCNEGTVPLKISGYILWCGENQANPVNNLNHHHVVLPGSPPLVFEAVTEILQAISGRPPFDWSKVQGDHTVSFAIEYNDGGETKRSDSKKQYVRIFSSGGKTLQGEISSFPYPKQ